MPHNRRNPVLRYGPAALALALVLTGTTPPARADDLTGAGRLLCASLTATRCTSGGCTTGDPAAWNIPRFIEIDLEARVLRTTAASGENRSTPIASLTREAGRIVIQGLERDRAFSFVIDEATGELNAAIATPAGANVVFAACTPLPAER